MSERINYEMTKQDLEDLLSAMQPTPAIMLQCGPLSSVQERANEAWAKLGKKMGFDPMTVKPSGLGDRFFTAVKVKQEATQKPHVKKDGSAWCATWPDFIDPQVSPSGFGDTPEEAIANLMKEPA